MGIRHLVAVGGLTVALCAACGSSSTPSSDTGGSTTAAGSGGAVGSVTFKGAVTGTWQKAGAATDSTCTANEDIIHIKGPGPKDEADLHVKADGSVWLDAPQNGGDYTSTTGGTFNAAKGFAVNAHLTQARGGAVDASGSLSC